MRGKALAWLLAPLLAAAAFAAGHHGLRRMRASRLLWSVERRTDEMIAQGVVVPQYVAGHLAALADAAALDPSEVAYLVARGGQYLLLREYDEAIRAYRAANGLEPRPETDLNLGKALWVKGDRLPALRAMTRAVRMAPHLLDGVPGDARAEVVTRLASPRRSEPSG